MRSDRPTSSGLLIILDSDKTARIDVNSGHDFHVVRVETVPPTPEAATPVPTTFEARVALAKELQDAVRSMDAQAKDEFAREDYASFQLGLMQFMSLLVTIDLGELRLKVRA